MRGKPRRSGGGQERGGGRLNATAPALALCVPIRRLLLLDVLANNGYGRTAATAGKVRGGPQRSTPQFLADAGVALFADQTAGNPLEAVHQCRDSYLRRVVHQQMHMVILPVELHQFRAEVLADGGEDASQIGQHLASEYATAVSGHKDQVNMQVKNTMPAMSYIGFFCHRPNIR